MLSITRVLLRPTPVRGISGRMLKQLAALARLVLLGVVLAGLWLSGLLYNAAVLLVLLAVPVTLLFKVVYAARKQVVVEFVRQPLGAANRGYLFQWLLRSSFWVGLALLLVGSMAPVQLTPEALGQARLMLLGSAGMLSVLTLFPRRAVGWHSNAVFGVGLAAVLALAVRMLVQAHPAGAVELVPPVMGNWVVLQGGPTPLLNHHHGVAGQRHALDLMLPHNGSWVSGPEDVLQSYPSFGQEVTSPGDGQVVAAEGAMDDQPPGGADLRKPLGNHVVLKLANDGGFVLLAHLQKGSVTVQAGQDVTCGQALGRVGSSGNSGAPHLHIQLQDGPDFNQPNLATRPFYLQGVHARGDRTMTPGTWAQRNDVLTLAGPAACPNGPPPATQTAQPPRPDNDLTGGTADAGSGPAAASNAGALEVR